MKTVDKSQIIQCWKRGVEDNVYHGSIKIYIDHTCFQVDNCNPLCMLDVWKDNKYLGSYTHIESLVFDLETHYCSKYVCCTVQVSRKRKRE